MLQSVVAEHGMEFGMNKKIKALDTEKDDRWRKKGHMHNDKHSEPEVCRECQGYGSLDNGEVCPACEGTGEQW